MKTPYNVEFLYRGMLRKPEEWRVVLAALAFFGLQFAFAAYLFLR